MAQAISNKVLVQSAKYCWMKCDYTMSGSTMNYSLSFYFEGGCAQLDNAWIKVGGTTIWSNTGRVHNYDSSQPNSVPHTVSIHSGSTTISGTKTVTFGITKYSGVAVSGSFSVTGGSTPSGLSVTFNSATWDSVNITSTLTNWGSGYSGTPNLEQIVCDGTATSSDWETKGRQVKQNATSAYSSTQSVTTANSKAFSGGYTIKGATAFHVAAYASTNVGYTKVFNSTTYYTPPAPMASLTYTQSQGSSNVTVNVSTVGGNSSNNTSASVATYMRYSTNGGSSYSNWTSMGTGTAWNTYTGSFTCAYKANVVIQTKQTYQGKDSTVKSVSFTAASGTAPSSLAASITSSTWNSATISGSCSYGTPSSASGRMIVLGLNINGSSLANRRENSLGATTSGSTTITNSSTNKGGAFNLVGMLPVYPYIWADNTAQTANSIKSVYYLPPAPGTLSYSKDAPLIYTINYIGVAANNYDSYDAADLTRTVRYKINNSQWWYIENDSNRALDYLTDYDVAVALGETLYVEAWMTYKGKNSEVSAFQVAGTERPVQMYGSVNGVAKEIQHLYASIGGQTKKIVKVYGSVGGVAKEVFEDV